jgi:murein DD-endopeptidase MepM/ murein hydrolase activator NlpD
MVINRGPTYLKRSTLNYLKEQKLEALADRMNLHELQNYTDQVLTQEKPAPKMQSSRRKKRGRNQSGRRLSQSTWAVRRRPSITGVEFSWPLTPNKFWLSSFFGPRKKPKGQWGFHKGIDMAAHRGTPVLASLEGVVEQAGYASGYGNTVVISHDRVYKTRYAHLDTISVKKGQQVTRGQCIGAVGDTGYTRKRGKDASHLHFELYEWGKQINPLYLLPARPR